MSQNGERLPFVEKKQEGRKTYFDAHPNGVRQVLDKTIPYVTVAKRNEVTGKWESYGYLALAKSGKTVRIMIIQKEGESNTPKIATSESTA